MIYLVEDDENIRELVVYTLNNSGFKAQGFHDAKSFWAQMDKKIPDLLLLDIMLPDEDGLSILKKLRQSVITKSLPIMMLTAKSSEYDKVIGFDNGADDYLPKPFGMMELLARIKALLRRTEKESADDFYQVGTLYVSPSRHKVTVDGEKVNLTLKEFELLCFLLANKGIVKTRDQILNKIWDYSFDGESRTVDVHIRTLRQKLGSAADLIETVRGVGYIIGDDNEKIDK